MTFASDNDIFFDLDASDHDSVTFWNRESLFGDSDHEICVFCPLKWHSETVYKTDIESTLNRFRITILAILAASDYDVCYFGRLGCFGSPFGHF